jgi:hypothetical protein
MSTCAGYLEGRKQSKRRVGRLIRKAHRILVGETYRKETTEDLVVD